MECNKDILISVKNISVGFKEKQVLNDISFNVLKNRHICISGNNGSGKTTLVRSVLKLIKPQKGSVLHSKNLKVAYLPEISERLLHIPMLVKDFINIYSRQSRLSVTEIELILSAFGVDKCKNLSITDISAGMLQKVLIARCFVVTPNVVVLDEPFNYIDAEAKINLLQSILVLAEHIKCSIILIDHNVSLDLLQKDFTHIKLT